MVQCWAFGDFSHIHALLYIYCWESVNTVYSIIFNGMSYYSSLGRWTTEMTLRRIKASDGRNMRWYQNVIQATGNESNAMKFNTNFPKSRFTYVRVIQFISMCVKIEENCIILWTDFLCWAAAIYSNAFDDMIWEWKSQTTYT